MSARGLSSGFRIPHLLDCIADPYFSCNPAVHPRTVLRVHANDQPTDPYYGSTELIAPFNGSAADFSPQWRTLTALGSAKISSTQSLYGTESAENPAGAVNGSCFVASPPLSGSATDSWTFEIAFFWPASTGTEQVIFQLGAAFTIKITSTGLISCVGFSGGVVGSAVPVGQWVRATAVFNYNVINYQFTFYMDGASQGSVSGAAFGAFSGLTLAMGCDLQNGGGSVFIGSWTQVRATRVTRYGIATDYTVAPMAFPTAFSATAADCSCAIPKTVTYAGTATPSPTEFEFGPRSFYIPALANPDVTPNGLIISEDADFDFGAENFVFRFWVFRLNNTRPGYVFYYSEDGGEFSVTIGQTQGEIVLNLSSSGGTSQIATGVFFPLNTWQMLVVERLGPNILTFLQGVLINTAAVPGGGASTINLNGPIGLGRASAPSVSPLNGYLDEIDCINGVAPYPAVNFTPPALPFCCHN